MSQKKKIYVHFVKPRYIGGKSELLKIQMEILCLKKLIKNFALTRAKKIHYRRMLEELVFNLKKNVFNLDSLLPVEKDIGQPEKIKQPIAPTNAKKEQDISHAKDSLKIPHKIKKNEIEEELIRIKQKLDLLNRT